MWRFCFSVWADERQVYIWTTSQLPDSNHCTVCMLQLHNEHAADGRMKKQSRAARQAEPWAVTEKEHGREQVTFKTSKWSSLKSATLRSLKWMSDKQQLSASEPIKDLFKRQQNKIKLRLSSSITSVSQDQVRLNLKKLLPVQFVPHVLMRCSEKYQYVNLSLFWSFFRNPQRLLTSGWDASRQLCNQYFFYSGLTDY